MCAHLRIGKSGHFQTSASRLARVLSVDGEDGERSKILTSTSPRCENSRPSHPSSAKSSRHASNKKGSEMVATADTSVAAKNEEER